MAKKGTVYTKTGGDYLPQTSTDQVMNPDGSALEQRLQLEEQAVKGKGLKASAYDYPFKFLGTYKTIGELNNGLDASFVSTDALQQGNLRAVLNGQLVMVRQIALNYSIGDWIQIAVGAVAPAEDGSSLVRSNTPGIYWRSRETGEFGVRRTPWQSIASINLKTVNGQSLIGSGDIKITGGGGQITIDPQLDPTSKNAIQNMAVALEVERLWDAIGSIDTDEEGGVIVCRGWADTSGFPAPSDGPYVEGDYGYVRVTLELYQYTNGTWVKQDEHPKKNVLYVNASAKSLWYWNGNAMIELENEPSGSDVKELRFVTIWANDGSIVTNWSGWQWDGGRNVLMWKSGTVVEYKEPNTSTLYIDCENNKIWRWTGLRMEELCVSSGGGGTNIDVVQHIVSPSSSTVPSTAAVVQYVANNGGSPDDTVTGWGEPDFQDPLRPEYYLVMDGQLVRESTELQAQVKWGTAYYDWPLRCFNGEIDDEITIQSGSYDGEVFMPSERIIHKHGVEMQFTTDDVLYSTHHGCFVLKVVDGGTTKYYKKWGNFYEWTTKPVNGVATYKPRTDCVFSDIHLEDDPDVAGVVSPTSGTDFTPEATGQSRRHSYIWVNSQSAFVDITTLMTDFTKAVHDCLASTVGGKVKGDMRLSDRIYYIGDLGRFADNKIATYGTGKVCIWNGNAYDVRKLKPVGANQMDQDYITGISAAEGFTIDGGKGVLFYRAHTMFTPNSHGTTLVTAFNLGAAKNCVLRNLTLRVLRDRDNSSVAGEFGSSSNVAFSCSDSCMKAFAFGNTSENILLDNIDLQGFFEDFDGKDHLGHDITVRNLRSRDVMLNVNSGTGWTFENCDIAQRECAGIGAHVFYPQGIWQAVFRNCRIRQGRYTSVAIGLHEIRNVTRTIDGESVTTTGYADLLFDGCQIEGGYLFEGDNSDSHDLSTVTLRKSRITQLYDMAMYGGSEDSGYGAVTRTVSCKRGAWIMEECSLELLTGSVFADFNSGGREATSIILRDTDVNTQKPSEGNILDLSSNNAGKVTFDNVRANYLSGRGGAIYYDPQKCVTLDAINAKVFPNERASGTTAQRPTNIEVGYCYFDTSLGSGTPPNGKPIWASKITESTDIITGEVTRSVTWVDATGSTV